jgi:hypothetical protein
MTAGDRINWLNIGLMIASCVAAFVLPFELFLLAYAVLGPLHYLTEISWIHDRKYFLREDGRWKPVLVWVGLVALTLIVMIVGLVREHLLHAAVTPVWEIGLFYIVFVAAALFAFGGDRVVTAGAIVLTALGAWLFSASAYYGLIAFLIITIVHVFVFTGAFVLFGALKARSVTGMLSLVVFVACALSFFVLAPDWAAGTSEFIRTSYRPFELLNGQLIRLFGLAPGSALSDIYASSAGLTVMRLIAFAYTYHYLNWFTKTSVIGWHRIPKVRGAAILALWVAAVGIYAYSYVLGFVVLYALSVLHVMLELPLNHQSFAGIGRELARMLTSRPATTATARPRAAARRTLRR